MCWGYKTSTSLEVNGKISSNGKDTTCKDEQGVKKGKAGVV